MTVTPFESQVADLKYLAEHDWTGLLNIEPGGGKGHPLDEPILTPLGWVPVGELNPGDFVIGSDGQPTRVVNIFDRGVLPTYRVTFRDGSSVRVDDDHLWKVKRTANGGRIVWETLSTKHLRSFNSMNRYEIPVTYVDFPERELPIAPYALGALIADGYLASGTVMWTKNDENVVAEMRRAVERSGYGLVDGKILNGYARRYGIPGLYRLIDELGLRCKSRDKRIPEEYLISSFEQRIALVNGLFDGDGSVRKERGSATYSTTSYGLAEDVRGLLWSLGVKATLREKRKGEYVYWMVNVHEDFNPFKTHPDKGLVTGTGKNLRRAFRSIEYVGDEPIRCIQVEAEDHLYITKDYIVTHNTYISLWAVQDSGAAVTLIVAPDATHATAWVPSVRTILGVNARTIGNTGRARKDALNDFILGVPGVYLCSPQFLARANITEWSGDFCVTDEVHELTNFGKKGQIKLSGSNPKEAAVSLAARFKHRLALSGTPWRNNFERAWAVARFLFPDLDGRGEVAYMNYWGWLFERMTFTEIYTDRKDRAGRPVKAKKWLTEAEPGEFINGLPCVVTHKRREKCCVFHPNGFLKVEEPNVRTHVVELHSKQKKAFRELEEQYLTWLGDNPLVVELPITMQQRLRQLTLGLPNIVVDEYGVEQVMFTPDCVSPFADFLVQSLTELDGEPVLVWVDSQRFAEALTERLNKAGFRAFEWSGATKDSRVNDLARFGVGLEFNVMVATIAAAGTGLDGLQHKCSTEFWLSESTDMTLNQQSRGRLERTGSTVQVDRHYIVDDLGYAAGKMSERLERQLELNKTLVRTV